MEKNRSMTGTSRGDARTVSRNPVVVMMTISMERVRAIAVIINPKTRRDALVEADLDV
jgi:hypothetical protein